MFFTKFKELSLWNKIGAVGSIASIVGVVLFFVPFQANDPSNSDVQPSGNNNTQIGNESPSNIVSQEAGNNSTQIGNVSGTVIVNPPNDLTSQELEPVDISGKWSQEDALELISSALRDNQWSDVDSFCSISVNSCNPVHSFVGEYSLIYREKESIIVVTASINQGSSCYACAPHLSFFEFERQSQGWKWTDSDVAVLRWGEYGEVKENSVKAYVIGDNIYGVILEGGGTKQGIFSGFTSIYARVGGSFRELLSLQTSKNDGAAYIDGTKNDWDSEIKVQQGTVGFFDLLVERKGLRDEKQFQEEELFKFNGQQYVSSRVYR